MRIAHLSDIHWNLRPPLQRVMGKRVLGTANLVLGGRGAAYSHDVQIQLVHTVRELTPDVVVISGDLTQTSLQDEFAWAQKDLRPLLDEVPTLVVPGNHDVYTTGARRDDRIAQYFGPWLRRGVGGVGRLDVGEVTVLGLDPCRPTPLSSGLLPGDQLQALRTLLGGELSGRRVLLTLHYPLVRKSGQPYASLNHGLRNAAAVLQVLREAATPPELVLHGHVHHAAVWPMPGLPTLQVNAGSGGYGHAPGRHVATFQVYELEGEQLRVERWTHDGRNFSPASVWPVSEMTSP